MKIINILRATIIFMRDDDLLKVRGEYSNGEFEECRRNIWLKNSFLLHLNLAHAIVWSSLAAKCIAIHAPLNGRAAHTRCMGRAPIGGGAPLLQQDLKTFIILWIDALIFLQASLTFALRANQWTRDSKFCSRVTRSSLERSRCSNKSGFILQSYSHGFFLSFDFESFDKSIGDP